MIASQHFTAVTLCDFEFRQLPGEHPLPICMVAHEILSGNKWRLWEEELSARASAPFPTSPDTLFVAYYASAELGCFLALGWDLPSNVLDLFVEFRVLTNGKPLPCGKGLLGALAYFGIAGIESVEKEDMRTLAVRGGPWTPSEKSALLDYCENDVIALRKLYEKMA